MSEILYARVWICKVCGIYFEGPDAEVAAKNCSMSHEELIFTPFLTIGTKMPLQVKVDLVRGKEIIKSMIYIQERKEK